jgi:hypothetical protein
MKPAFASRGVGPPGKGRPRLGGNPATGGKLRINWAAGSRLIDSLPARLPQPGGAAR